MSSTNQKKKPQKGEPSKRTSTPKKQQKAQSSASNGTTVSSDFLFLGESPEEKEGKWLTRITELIEKKRTRPVTDRFSPALEQLYHDLLETLCHKCGLPNDPIFERKESIEASKRDEGSHNTSEKNTKEYKAQVEELNAKVKNLETEIKTTKEGQTTLQEENARIKTENQTQISEIKDLKDKINNLERTLKEKVQNSSQLNNNESNLQVEITRLKKNLDEKNEELEKEKSNRNMLEKERSAIQNKMKTMEEEATSIKKSNSDQEKDLETKNKEQVDRLTSANKRMKSNEEEQRKKLESKDKEIKTLNERITTLLEQVGNHDTVVNEIKSRMKSNEEEQTKKLESNENEIKTLNDRIKTLLEQVGNHDTVVNEIKSRVRIEVDEYCEKNKQLLMDVKSKEHEILDLKRSNIDFERVKLSQEKQIENQSVTIQRLEKETNELKKIKKNQAKGPDQRIKELEEETVVLRDRLSQIAGSKMTDGNPAIADLGDPNRPTQLGEKFSELYDNEWTDAMEELEKAGNEKTNINTLKTIVEKAYEFGKTRSAAFMKELEKSFMILSNSIQVTPAINKLIKELRKNIASLVTEGIYQAFVGSHTEFKVSGDHLKAFIRKTVGLCWFMAIQDPPVVLTTHITGKFDTDRFRHYTKSGSTVDYVVWPVVYLHEGGPIICKGVAQGK